MRAQQEPVEPPFAVPQWFTDHNAVLWGDVTLRASGLNVKTGEPSSDGSSYDFTFYTESGEVKEMFKDKSEDLEDLRRLAKAVEDRTRYHIEPSQWQEIRTTLIGMLRAATSNSQYQHEPAVKANNLLLHYAGKHGDYLLDLVVRRLAQQTSSDLITLDVQDIADLISEARGKDPSAAEGRMLSYEILAEAPPNEVDATKKDAPEVDSFDEEGFESAGLDFPMPGGATGTPILIGKPFTIDLSNLGNIFGKPRRGSRGGSLTDMLSNQGGRVQTQSQTYNLGPPAGPFRSLVEGVLSTITEKKRRDPEVYQQLEERDKQAEAHKLPRDTTIVYVKDVRTVQTSHVGGMFLRELYTAVEARRVQGESIVIIGTESAKGDLDYQQKNIESLQRTPEDSGGISRTIVITPFLPNKRAEKNLLEDNKRRIATINLRHVWEMMRLSSSEKFLGLEPGFWRRNVYEELTKEDKFRLSLHVWPFQNVHRLVTYIRGISDHRAFIEEDDIERGRIIPLISSVGRKLGVSDYTKFRWAGKAQKSSSKRLSSVTPAKDSPLLETVRSTANKHEKRLLAGVVESSKIRTTFADVHAPTQTIEALQTLTTLSLLRPDAFTYGVLASDRIPGLLLYGPPGTGKTLLAKAVAKESGATMLEVSAADLNDMYVGEGEKNVKALFSLARKLSPCVVFLDEADAIFSARSAAGRRVSHRELLNQFLKEWDGMSNDAGSAFLMVATNRPMDFDDAILRRLPRRLLVDLPTEQDRLEILKIHLKNEQLAPEIDIAGLAKQTPFYSGSDLKNLCVAAALNAVKEERRAQIKFDKQQDSKAEGEEREEWKFPERRVLKQEDFVKALEEITASVSEDMNSLKEVKRFDEQYGDRRGKKGRGKRLGFGVKEEDGGDTVKVRS